MVALASKMSATEFLRLEPDPPGVRRELLDGRVFERRGFPPSHGFAVVQLISILVPHIDPSDLGELFGGIDTMLGDYTVVRPDLAFFSIANLHLIGEKFLEGPPDLAVEVISPSSIDVDREDKFEQYRAAKVRYYWIVDPTLKTVEGWELKRSKYGSIGRAQGVGTIQLAPFPDLEIPLRKLWRK